MSIARKILLGCLSLTLVTLVVGLLSGGAQSQLAGIALRIYDEAFMSMSYLRSAQNTFVGISRDLASGGANSGANRRVDAGDVSERFDAAAGDLDVARDRAMSPQGRAAAEGLHARMAEIAAEIRRTGALPPPERIEETEDAFDTAVEIYAGDGYRFRRAVAALVQVTRTRTWAAMAVSLAVALGITVLLSRAIIPSVRYAVGIATAIAGGKLDNRIEGGGGSETGVLLRALATMQASIAEKMARIRALMAEQASSHASEIASQHARFEAALNNMVQGLCMFGADGRVLVHNRRFADMFGAPEPEARVAETLPAALLPEIEAWAESGQGSGAFTRTLEDGRVIEASQELMAGGGWVATFDDVTERRRAEAQLAHMARHDALTGLPNRLAFREQMERALAQARRGGGLAVLCLGLDHFKAINDTLGHPVGDALLRAVAQRLVETTREADLVVRLGGDEFAVIQSAAVQPTEAKALGERLVAMLAAPFEIEGHAISMGASVGIAVTSGGAATADGLLMSADLALHRAKADGRGVYRFFEQEMDARMQARRLLEIDLRRAIAEEEFTVFYQPLVTTQTGAVSGFEALVRWPHPARGMVSPGEFIPLAEEIGLIAQIGSFVLKRACRDAAGWPGHVKVAVNLSPLQFRNLRLGDEVAAALASSGLPAERLELEITESMLLQDSEATLSILHEIRALGVRVSMDDFGTGYSSLGYLRLFPFDKIKIDQSFVRNLHVGRDSLAIIRAVVTLGRSLGIGVVAEGVETQEQFETLRLEGCHQVQGYLFSRPKPAEAVPGLIEQHATRLAS